MKIQVMLVDDHSIVRQGMKSIISQQADIEVVAECADGLKAVELAAERSPDVIVMDITLPNLNGLDASRQIIKSNKKVKVLILSMHESRAFIEKALSYGVKGYLLKESAADEIVRAIREVYAGNFYLAPKASSLVVNDYLAKKNKKPAIIKSGSLLTNREREILQLIAEGNNSKDIASRLKLSLKTVLAHRNNIMKKTDLHNQAQLVRFAIKEGLIII